MSAKRQTAERRATLVMCRSPPAGQRTRPCALEHLRQRANVVNDPARDQRRAGSLVREFTESLGACQRPFHRSTTLHAREIGS